MLETFSPPGPDAFSFLAYRSGDLFNVIGPRWHVIAQCHSPQMNSLKRNSVVQRTSLVVRDLWSENVLEKVRRGELLITA